ncbi:phosphomannomutase [Cognatiyoonia sp. IB215182]|uniref:phosphomannomutase n=1 Tax=Cognatiyoonia sp. IB215182 TaxID=3097353 RepID=UPI002A0FB47E|nr:phosphomannomutase [Cognatiyoonia sp. IB215182]MDX8354571.1 phosphomannomutase [Cognatiyoonia sp. IB215182]
MAPKFGTSGLRGLVTELTPACVTDHVRAFAMACPTGTGLFVAHDLRPSSPDIAMMVMQAGQEAGLQVTMCGAVPTPALALAAMTAGAAAVMVTGSHIPADRNGLKFYTPQGEITKAHEAAILAALGKADTVQTGPAVLTDGTASASYIARYVDAYGDALKGQHIGVYGHSAVGRDMMVDLLSALGARVIKLGWSDTFVPVDTEAVASTLRQQLKDWAAEHQCDAIVSTDGDGDRPLVADATGEVVVGDILGQITAATLQADHVVTPVSSNTGVELGGRFQSVTRTQIGSPFVIAAMEKRGGRIVGYEANGGFLLGFGAAAPEGKLAPLMTRDAVLPIVASLATAKEGGLAARVAAEPARFTAADRLQEVPQQKAQDFVAQMLNDPGARAGFLDHLDATESAINAIDGPRMTLRDGRVVHVRPSGNAPELRLYVEADTAERANATLKRGLAELAKALGS